MTIDPSLLAMLAKAGIDATGKNLDDIIGRIDHVLEEEYHFRRPRKMVAVWFAFREVETRTIGARQYVLERGTIRGRYWRIREKAQPFLTHYFIWDAFTEEQVREVWSNFIGLVEARDLATRTKGAP